MNIFKKIWRIKLNKNIKYQKSIFHETLHNHHEKVGKLFKYKIKFQFQNLVLKNGIYFLFLFFSTIENFIEIRFVEYQ